MAVYIATSNDLPYLLSNDKHITPAMMERKVNHGEVLILRVNDAYAGWLRWGYFWDSIPFMNLLHINEALRGQGYGRDLVTAWEDQMRDAGYTQVMTSTQSDEEAQHFYRKLGYIDRGALLLPDEPTELIFIKSVG